MVKRYKVASGPTDIVVDTSSQLPQGKLTVDTSSTMFQYMHMNTVDGFPVAQDAQKLAVANQQQIRSALNLKSTPHVFMKWVQPDSAQLLQYQNLLKQAADQKIIIQDQTHQFDSAKGKMLIFVKYSQVNWTLNPRYEYLKQQEL